MANEQNLRPAAHKLSVEEQKKGGRKSVESRRRLKDAREAMNLLMDMVLPKPYRKMLVDGGIPVPDDATMSYWMQWYPMIKALKKGDTKAVEIMNRYAGNDRKYEEEIKKLQEENKKLKLEQELLKQEQEAGILIEDTSNLAKMISMSTEEINEYEKKEEDESESDTDN